MVHLGEEFKKNNKEENDEINGQYELINFVNLSSWMIMLQEKVACLVCLLAFYSYVCMFEVKNNYISKSE